MTKTRKAIIWFLCIILFILGAMFVFLKVYFSEGRLIAFIVPRVEEAIHRKVTVGSARFAFLSGVSIDDLIIKEEDGSTDFIRIKRFNMLYDLFALLRGNISISGVLIDRPFIRIVRRADGSFNFDSLLNALKSDGKTASSSNAPPAPSQVIALTLNKFFIRDGKYRFYDETKRLPLLKGKFLVSVSELKVDRNGDINYNGMAEIDTNLSLNDTPISTHSKVVFDTLKANMTSNITIGRDNIDLFLSLDKYLSKHPLIDLKVLSNHIDIDKLYPVFSGFSSGSGPDIAINSKISEGASSTARKVSNTSSSIPMTLSALVPLPVPVDNISLNALAEIKRLRVNGVNASDIKIACIVKDGRMDIQKDIGRVFGGKVQAVSRVELETDGMPFEGVFKVTGLDIKDIALFYGINKGRFPISGSLFTSMTFKGRLMPFSAIERSLVLDGGYGVKNGAIEENPVTLALASLFKIKELKRMRFKELKGKIRFENGWLVSNSKVNTKYCDLIVDKGRFALDGRIDAPLSIRFSKKISSRLIRRKSYLQVIVDKDGRITIPVKIKGRYDEPVPVLGLDAIKERAKKTIKKEVGKKINKFISDFLFKKKGK